MPNPRPVLEILSEANRKTATHDVYCLIALALITTVIIFFAASKIGPAVV